MAGNIQLSTVLVGLEAHANGVDFNINVNTMPVSTFEGILKPVLESEFGEDAAASMLANYSPGGMPKPASGSPFDVVAYGPTYFLYAIDKTTAANWRFREGGADYVTMCRKSDSKIPSNMFKKNFNAPEVIDRDGLGVLMFGVYDCCASYDKPPYTNPKFSFDFDIFMSVSQKGLVTEITIDPKTDNRG